MMERYREYKDSGVKWLGEIPSHWEVVRGLGVFSENKSKNTQLENSTVLSLSYGKIIVKKDIDSGLVPEEYSSYQIVRPGCIIVRSTDLQNDKTSLRIGYVCDEGIITSAYLGLQVKGNNNDKYLYYFLHDWDITKEIYRHGNGLRQSLSWNDLRDNSVLLPPLSEQDAIVRYLDTATSEIDKAIAMQQKMIDLLNERKQIIIQNAVTKGLDENVEMKESGVEWIGRIPKHWEVRRGKFLFRVVNEYSTTGQEELLTVSDRTGITPRCMKNVNMFMSESLIGYKKCQKGDICSNIMWMWHGAVGVTEYNGVISPSYGVYRQIAVNYENKYLDYMLRLPRLVEVYGICSTGLTESRLRLYPDDFMNIQFFIPPVEEQKSIVLQIQKQITDIEKSIRNAENLITLLQERKQIIINEVVTGKVRVI